DSDILDRVDDAVGDQIATHDPAEDVHQDGADLRIGEDELECRGDAFGGSASAHVQEIRRLPAVQLDQIHGRHRQPGAVHHARDIPVEGDVVQVVLAGSAL